jgi:penicillin-binding protein 1A
MASEDQPASEEQPASETTHTPEAAASAAEPAFLQTLSAAVLLKLLARRVVDAVRNAAGATARWFSAHARPSSARPSSARTLLPAIGAKAATFKTHLAQKRVLAWAGIVALLPVVYIAYCVLTIPFAANTPVPAASSAMLFEAADGNAFATRGILKGDAIAPDQIPPVLASAVVSVEDRRFYQHGGLDLRAIGRAAWHDVTGRRIEGGSTITQQLARRLYLTQDRSLKRKVQEAALALWLDMRLSKKEILARYLNTVYFGDGAYGADPAARRYFGKSAQQLSLSEAAMLAGLIRAPSQLEPDRNMAGAQERATTVLDTMTETGAISQQQADNAKQHPAVLRVAPGTPPGSNYFIDAAATEARSHAGTTTADLTIKTTLNRNLQQLAETVIARRLSASGQSKNVGQAALVALASDGAILAMVGGRDYNTSQFNRVTQARRQPGSLFKLFVYLTAMRKGYSPDTVLVDQPVSIGNWEPENYGDKFYGPVTLRTGFAHSLNSIAVQLAQAVGINNVIDTAHQLGVHSDLPAVPSVALGSGNVTLLEMTRAFANVALNKTTVEPYAVQDVAADNQAAFSRSPPPDATVDNPTVHAAMIDLLSSVVREGTGRAAALDQPVGGKTGTSEDYHDAWFVGFTSDLIVGVWVGNDDNSPMNSVTGGGLPASIWHDFVRAAEAGHRPQSAPGVFDFNGVSLNDNPAAPPRQPYQNNFFNPFRLFFHF